MDEAAAPIFDFDQHSVEYRDRWREISDANLARCPVAWTEAWGGFWVVAGYEALRTVMLDFETYSSRWNLSPIREGPAGISIPPGGYPKIPAELDPPEFTVYRRLISQALSPERSESLEPFIRQTVQQYLDLADGSEELDFILDLTAPVATAVVLRVLGLPLDGCHELAEALHTMEYAKSGTPAFERAASHLVDWASVVEVHVKTRRSQPTGDLISHLANWHDGALPIQDIVGACFLVMGSIDNTAGFIAGALHWLHESPKDRRMLADDPARIPAAVEELLRHLAPIHGLARTAKVDAELDGQRIRAGDRLWLHFAAANRDPAVFEHPEEVRFDRAPNRHATFGFGIHRCVGAPVTRIEAKVVLEMVLARAPGSTIRVADTRRYQDIAKFNGFERMPGALRQPDGHVQ